MKVLIEDKKFLKKNIKNISRLTFNNKTLKFIYELISEYFSKYDTTPNYDVIEYLIDENIPKSYDEEGNEKNNVMKRQILDQLKYEIKDIIFDEGEATFLKDEIIKRLNDELLKKMVDQAEKGYTDALYDGLKEVEQLQKYNGMYEMKRIWD